MLPVTLPVQRSRVPFTATKSSPRRMQHKTRWTVSSHPHQTRFSALFSPHRAFAPREVTNMGCLTYTF